jgi:hypothetical protein
VIAKSLREKVKKAIEDASQPKITKSSFNLEWTKVESKDSILNARSQVNRSIVESSLKLLSGFGQKYKSIIDLNVERLNTNFY